MSGDNNIFLISDCVETQDFLYLLFDYNQIIHADYIIKIPSFKDWKLIPTITSYTINYKISQFMFDSIYNNDSRRISTASGNLYCNSSSYNLGIISDSNNFFVNLPTQSTEPNGVTYNDVIFDGNDFPKIKKMFDEAKKKKGSPDGYDTITINSDNTRLEFKVNDLICIISNDKIIKIKFKNTEIEKEFSINDRIQSQLPKIISQIYIQTISNNFIKSQLEKYISQVEYTPFPGNPNINKIKKDYQQALLAREPDSPN